ncbi:MAG: hypothetical protein ABI882_14985, partial [Acidobacteriota bacterium]
VREEGQVTSVAHSRRPDQRSPPPAVPVIAFRIRRTSLAPGSLTPGPAKFHALVRTRNGLSYAKAKHLARVA